MSLVPTGEFSVRSATPADRPELARLLTQLGHPTTALELEQKWASWCAEGNSAVVAAADSGGLLGVATLHRMIVLHRPRPVGRITSLVVDESVRGRGIGKRLVIAAERELAAAGCGLLEVTSNLRRVDAHAFYEHLGYERTSARFARDLVAAPRPISAEP